MKNFILLLFLGFPITSSALEPLEKTWPVCKDLHYDVDPDDVWSPHDLTYLNAATQLKWLGDHGDKAAETLDMAAYAIELIHGYTLRYLAERADPRGVWDQQQISTFCKWLSTHSPPE